MEKIDQNRRERTQEKAGEWVDQLMELTGTEAVFNRLETVYAGFCRDGRLRGNGVSPEIDSKFAAVFEKALKLDLVRTLETIRRRISEYSSVKWQRDPKREAYENELAVLTGCEKRLLKLLRECEIDAERELVGERVELAME